MNGLIDSRQVPGEGPASAKLVFVGEAPGREESETGRPFVGKAGENLNFFLNYLGCERKDVYITNAVKYRPYKVSESGSVSNRTPSFSELAFYREDLINELLSVNPEIIVTLGNAPLRSIFNSMKVNIGSLHGRVIIFEKLRLFPLYHPASIIYNPALKESYYRDLDELKKVVGFI